jgi:hypothetical protein
MQAAHLAAIEKRIKMMYITLLLVNAEGSKTLVKVGGVSSAPAGVLWCCCRSQAGGVTVAEHDRIAAIAESW